MNDAPPRDVEVFTKAIALTEAERSAFLEQACQGDAALRHRVEALLESHKRVGDFLEQTPPDSPAAGRPRAAGHEKPGDRIGRYKLLQPIGEGGCGVVYMAEQEEPVRRRVALKVIKPGMDTKSVIARFEAERQALALMDHPCIAKVFDAGETGSGRPYFVMELVRGVRITDYCDENSLPTRQRLELFVQVCEAVQHAHQKGIIHRDIKPSNILVTTTEQGAALPVVIDFGIAKATTNQRLTDKTLFTAFEMLIGTPAYMSPEQAAMTSVDVDTRSDIYSLGVLLYELLTAATPFDAGELLKSGLDEVRRVIREQEPVRPSTRLSRLTGADLTTVAQRRRAEPPSLIRTVRGDLDWIVMKALEKDRTRRYEAANGLAVDVQHFLANEAVSARPPSVTYKLRKLVLRHKLLFAGLGIIAVLLIAALALVTLSLARERQAHQQADHARTQADLDKGKAQAEATKSRQVSLFLRDMLEGVGPTAALGRDTGVLREILERAEARVASELTNQWAVEAELRFTMGQVYEDMGAYPQASNMFRRVWELNRKHLPEQSPDNAIALTRLGRVQLRAQNLEEAERHALSALAIWQGLRDEESLEATVTLETLAMVRWQQKRFPEAESMMQRVIVMRRRILPADNVEVLNAINNLGNVLHGAGRFAEAEQLYRQLLETKDAHYNKEHPSVAMTLQNLGSVLIEQGKLAEAREHLERALIMRRKLLGTQHPQYATSLFSMADALQRSQKYPDAEALYREALELELKLAGKEDPMVLRIVRNLARVLAAQRKHQEVVAHLAPFLTPEQARTPARASMLALRTEALARLARWKEAATDAALLVEHLPADHQHYHTLAPLLVASGDLGAYTRLTREIGIRFSGATNVSAAERMAKDCLFHPASGADLQLVSALASTAVDKGQDRPAFPLYQVTKSMAELRQGNFARAIEWASKPSESAFPHAAVEATAVLAMAQHHLKQPEAARASLARAGLIRDNKLARPAGGDIGSDWRDWIIAHALLEEARALIQPGVPATANEPKP